MTAGNDHSTPPSDHAGPNGPSLGSTPASDAFARESVMPALTTLAATAEAKALTTADVVDALINTQAAFLSSILGPKATGDLLQAQGRQIAAAAANAATNAPASPAVSIHDTAGTG